MDLCNNYSWLSYQKYMFLQLFGCVLYVIAQLYMLPDHQQDEMQSVLFGCAAYLTAQPCMLPEYATRWSTVCVLSVSLCNVIDSAYLQFTCAFPLLFHSLTV